MSEGKTCFVIAPIGDEDSETRKRSDQILDYIITPAVEQCGYKAVRADEISKAGIVTNQVIQHIVDDPLVIADLTERNPNVFYELAIRHAVQKPVVQIIQKGEKLPFDIAPMRAIPVDYRDLATAAEAKKQIIKQIKAVEEDPKIDTPISAALDWQVLRQSDNPINRSLADIVEAVSLLRVRLMEVDAKVTDYNSSTSEIWDTVMNEIRDLSRRFPDVGATKLDNARIVIKALLGADMPDDFEITPYVARSLQVPPPIVNSLIQEIEREAVEIEGDF